MALSHLRAGIYGRNGTGKTTFAASITGINVLVVSVDDEGIRPYLHKPNIRVAKIRRWRDVIDVYDVVANPKNKIQALVWDTWSRVQDLALGHVCAYEPADPAKLRDYIDRIPKSPQDWRGWNQVGALCSEWQRNFNVLPVNILYLMQEQDRQSETEFGTVTRTGPRLTPEALKGIRDSLEILGRLYVSLSSDDPAAVTLERGDGIDPNVKETRRLFIGQHDRFIAK